MKYDTRTRTGHQDGWVLLTATGVPAHNALFTTRQKARTYRKHLDGKHRLVRARVIIAWKP